MSKNIYNLFRQYNRLLTDAQRTKYLAALSHDMRATFKSLINYANNSDRFENIYDGWIESLEEELVVLEVYSVILKTQKTLNRFCVDDVKYESFIEHKKSMLFLLLENKQYTHASRLLDVYMFSNEFKEQKLKELREKVLTYLIDKKMVLPKKLINEIYNWVNELKLPTYLTTDIEGDFTFTVQNNAPSIDSLQEDVEKELSNSVELKKIVDRLIEFNRVNS
ncbi:MAG: hypothetical protein IE878_05170 [Epsilonproteobacteria bacterium]|nr:hypothetical protein [Campylobacterota bacterium]